MTARYLKLGRAARRELDDLASRSRGYASLEDRLFANPPQPSRWSPWFAVTGFALSAAIVALVWAWPAKDLTFTVAGDGSGNVGQPIAAVESPKLLAFSEGTTVWISPAGTARVVRAQVHSADVSLDGGTLKAQVKHHDDRRWVFHAGPYEVLVTGTTFDLSWDANTERLTVAMHEGRVLVQGGTMPAPREVRAGETLVVGEEAQVAAPINEAPRENPAPRAPRRPARTAAPPAPKPVALPAPAPGPTTSAAARLFGRADAARLAGDEAQAVVLFEDVAERFPSDGLAGLASFAAGRLRLLRLHDPHAALIDLERARRLGLPAPLNEDCHARIVEALTALRRTAVCKDEQARYLAAYPRGPHADVVNKACR